MSTSFNQAELVRADVNDSAALELDLQINMVSDVIVRSPYSAGRLNLSVTAIDQAAVRSPYSAGRASVAARNVVVISGSNAAG